uniref:Pneumococcal surface protein n=1 Tax=Gongylonema pulchrum TaxID=637853 RepID=A0A183DMN1_9BILA
LAQAKEQEQLRDGVEQKLDEISKRCDDLQSNRYIAAQELVIATEDVACLRSLLEQIPMVQIESITQRQAKEQLAKRADTVKNQIRNLLIPLEKDVRKEQELMRDLHEMLSTLTAIGDDVIAIDPNVEPSEKLENIGELAENLRQLKGKAEKLEEKLRIAEGLVKRAPVTDDLSARVTQLQNALADKSQLLTMRIKLQAIAPEISLITESIQNRVNEIEQSPVQTVAEQNATLSELEAKKRQLVSLVENIPPGDEGNEMRERSNWQLSQLNDLLARLAAAVGEKLAALAAFNATKDEVEAQIASLPIVADDQIATATVHGLDNRLQDL